MSTITQRGVTAPFGLTAANVFQTSTDSALATLVGTHWDLADGREVMLVSTPAATTVAPGYFYQDAALVAGEQAVTITSYTAASGSVLPAIVLTSGSTTAVAANQFQGGSVVVVSSTGIGQTLKIASNTAATAGNSYVYTIYLEDVPGTALTATSVINVSPAHGANVIISPAAASLTNIEAGVGLYAIAPSSYGFLVTRGVTAVVGVGAGIAIGAISVGAAGAGVIFSAALPVLGYNAATITGATGGLVYVCV